MSKEHSQVNILKDLLCGCFSGWGQVLTMMPFENIKVKVVSRPDQYTGYIQAFKKTISQQGYFSFYKGMLMPLLGVGFQVAVQFGIVQTMKKMLIKSYGNADGTLNPKYSFLCGAFAGIFSGIILTPLDHARFRVALNKTGQKVGSVKTAVNIFQQHGLRKLFLGFNSTIVRQSIGLSIYFGVYDNIMSLFKRDGKISLAGSLMAGGTAGVFTWAAIYPIDYIKTLIQTDSLQKPRYKSSISCAIEVFKNNSLKTFFTGVQIMLARAFVVNACGFMCFQIGKKVLYTQN